MAKSISVLIVSSFVLACVWSQIYDNSKFDNVLSILSKGDELSIKDIIRFAEECSNNNVNYKDLTNYADSTQIQASLSESQRYLTNYHEELNSNSYNSFFCPAYSTSGTGNATYGPVVSCNFDDFLPSGIESGTTIRIRDCSSNCHGDQYIRLLNTNEVVAGNVDGK